MSMTGVRRMGRVRGVTADGAPAEGRMGSSDVPALDIQVNALQAMCRQVFGF
ncbi:MAG: hypothetical protein JF588_24615, partial [Caulobacterales bacterium]|nr:hypothetical protein [Caulobacterales bacterium]